MTARGHWPSAKRGMRSGTAAAKPPPLKLHGLTGCPSPLCSLLPRRARSAGSIKCAPVAVCPNQFLLGWPCCLSTSARAPPCCSLAAGGLSCSRQHSLSTRAHTHTHINTHMHTQTPAHAHNTKALTHTLHLASSCHSAQHTSSPDESERQTFFLRLSTPLFGSQLSLNE